ncbi:f-box family protein [Corchorus olitorius]|uniref:F-box family protein n=1 Tax=Corchorus olitorius TaxID=93759 RepID=A0A1R3J5A9_9ROSI|nr:f-box family protein [Corchorus olitorius]
MGENRTLFIDAPKLKRLGFRCEGYYRGKVVIDAPDLRTFHYCALITPSVCSFDVDLASIDDAYFNMCIYEDEEDPKCREYVVHWINTLEKFRNAKSLTLSWGTIKVLAMFPSLLDENRVSFANLKQLKIDLQYWLLNEVKVPGCVLNFFLNSSTRLEFVCEGTIVQYETNCIDTFTIYGNFLQRIDDRVFLITSFEYMIAIR